MSLFIVKNLSKSFSDKALFKDISFTIEPKQKITVVAPNGTGKTTLFRILLGLDDMYDGEIEFDPNISIGYLQQGINLEETRSLWDYISKAKSKKMKVFLQYKKSQEENETIDDNLKIQMDNLSLWGYEEKIKQMIKTFKLPDTDIKYYSGGQQKRLMLLRILLDEHDLLFLDEPTNHLDYNMLEYLESYLKNTNKAVFIVSHDRYFLNQIIDTVFEIDKQKLFIYKGNYSNFVKKKKNRIISENSRIEKARSLLKKEQEWMNQGARARETKAKHRVERYYELKEQAEKKIEKIFEFSIVNQRIGDKILELKDIYKSFDKIQIINDFSFSFQKGQKIGIIGKNGVGKTTFLNLLTQEIAPDKGKIEKGKTISFGYFRQQIEEFDKDKTVIEVVKEYGKEFLTAQKKTMSVAKFLENFHFHPRTQHQEVRYLSGGQKKRLTLLTILVQNPNFLILDEPTNDFDILTLHALEEFLIKFQGCVLAVSHDRYFMDKVFDQLFVFEGNGIISQFIGSYTDYRNKFQNEDEEKFNKFTKKKKVNSRDIKKKQEKLMREITKLEGEKEKLTSKFEKPMTHEELAHTSSKLESLIKEVNKKEEEWLNF